jgi:hypothetical protein
MSFFRDNHKSPLIKGILILCHQKVTMGREDRDKEVRFLSIFRVDSQYELEKRSQLFL